MDKKDFPKCKPQFLTINKLNSDDFRVRYKALRTVSNNFIARSDVRGYIFEYKGQKCYLCGASGSLQIDHVISVYEAAKRKLPYGIVNMFDNLMPICEKCNAGKRVLQGELWRDDQNRE